MEANDGRYKMVVEEMGIFDFDVVIRTIITASTVIVHITKYYYIIKIKI